MGERINRRHRLSAHDSWCGFYFLQENYVSFDILSNSFFVGIP